MLFAVREILFRFPRSSPWRPFDGRDLAVVEPYQAALEARVHDDGSGAVVRVHVHYALALRTVYLALQIVRVDRLARARVVDPSGPEDRNDHAERVVRRQ